MSRLFALMLWVAFAASLVGCSGSGSRGDLSLVPAEGEPGEVVTGDFDTVVYAAEDHQTVHAVLIDGPVDSPSRAMVVRMYWRSRAGLTPFDPSATNAMVRYIRFSDDGALVYGGGGLVRPLDKAGRATYRMSMQDVRLALMDATEGAFDLETAPKLATASGSFTAVRDEALLAALSQKLQVLVNRKLGYPRIVRFGPGDDAGSGDGDVSAAVGGS